MTDTLTLQKEKYMEKLLDPQWRQLRLLILERDGHQCRLCGSRRELLVHHRQYHRKAQTGEWSKPWEYHPILLVTLCGSCHSEGHRIFPIPIKDI